MQHFLWVKKSYQIHLNNEAPFLIGLSGVLLPVVSLETQDDAAFPSAGKQRSVSLLPSSYAHEACGG